MYSTGRTENPLATITLEPAQAAAYTIDDQQRMRRARNYFAWQARLVRREIGRRVIEVGSGLGNFTRMLLDCEAVIALDKERACVELLTQRYPRHPNLHAFACDASDGNFLSFAHFAADSCVCLNVLEHVKDDAGLLRRMASVLVPKGVIVLLLPAFPALYGPIDRNLGHFRRYTMRSLHELAAATGLRVKKAHYMNTLGFFGWWWNSRISRREAQSRKQIQFFDRLLVPLISQIESLAPPPFGQSIFAVLQRP